MWVVVSALCVVVGVVVVVGSVGGVAGGVGTMKMMLASAAPPCTTGAALLLNNCLRSNPYFTFKPSFFDNIFKLPLSLSFLAHKQLDLVWFKSG